MMMMIDDDDDDTDDNDEYDVFSFYQWTSDMIGTMGGPINYDFADDNDYDDDDADDDNNDDDDDDDDVCSKNVFGMIIIVEALSEWPEAFKSFY